MLTLYILPISNSIFTSNNIIKFYITTNDIYKKKNLEHKCILQESFLLLHENN